MLSSYSQAVAPFQHPPSAWLSLKEGTIPS